LNFGGSHWFPQTTTAPALPPFSLHSLSLGAPPVLFILRTVIFPQNPSHAGFDFPFFVDLHKSHRLLDDDLLAAALFAVYERTGIKFTVIRHQKRSVKAFFLKVKMEWFGPSNISPLLKHHIFLSPVSWPGRLGGYIGPRFFAVFPRYHRGLIYIFPFFVFGYPLSLVYRIPSFTGCR